MGTFRNAAARSAFIEGRRQGGEARCSICGRPLPRLDSAVEVDHTVPRSKGGGGGDNLRLSCKRCNRAKGGELLEEIGMDGVLEVFSAGVGPNCAGYGERGISYWNNRFRFERDWEGSEDFDKASCVADRSERSGFGAAGFVLRRGEDVHVEAHFLRDTSDNMAAVLALHFALENVLSGDLGGVQKVRLNTHYPFYVWVIEQGMLSYWNRRGWLTKGGKPIRNAWAWAAVYEQIRLLRVDCGLGLEGVSAHRAVGQHEIGQELALQEAVGELKRGVLWERIAWSGVSSLSPEEVGGYVPPAEANPKQAEENWEMIKRGLGLK